MITICDDLRKSILQAAIQGKLTEQLPEDGNAGDLYKQIQTEKQRLIKEGKIKKEKSLPEIKDDEIPFEIPDNWKWVRLTSVCNIVMGSSPSGESLSSVKVGTEFHQGKTYFSDRFVSISPVYTVSPVRIAPAMSILMSVRAPVGDVNITDREICIGRGLAAIIPCKFVVLSYLYLFLMTKKEALEHEATGTTFKAIGKDNVTQMLIPLPPLAEQMRIVACVNELMKKIDEVERTEKAITTLYNEFPGDMKASLLQAAIQGKLTEQLPEDGNAEDLYKEIQAEKQRLIKEGKIKKDKNESYIFRRDNSHYEKQGNVERCIDDEIPFEIPENWKWIRLANIAIGENGDRSNKYPVENDYVMRGIPFFGSKDMVDNSMSFKDVRYISQEKFNELGNGKLINNDIVCLLRGSVGKTALFKGSDEFSTGFICAQMMIIRCLSESFVDYVFLCMKTPEFTDQVSEKTTGTAVRQLPAKDVMQMMIPLPPLAEQKLIVAKLNQLLSLCDHLLEINT